MSLADGVAQLLNAWGLVNYDETGLDGDVFIDTMPNAPDEAVALTETGGSQPDVVQGYDYPVLQVRVRSTADPRPGRERARAIYNVLHGLSGATLPNGVYIVSMMARESSPEPMGLDDNRRHEYVNNYVTVLRNPTLHRE